MWRLTGRLLFAVPFLLSCGTRDGDLAGGSSEVDNPEITIAFTNSLGVSASFTGTVRIYAADQNPALEPDPITQIQARGDTSLKFSRFDFSRKDTGGAAFYNILLTGDDSSGAALQNLIYNPSARKFTGLDGQGVSRIRLPLVKRVRYQASLDRADKNKLERIFIPGTPFQSVVVDSSFIFEGVPNGVYPLRLIRNYDQEIRLPDSLNTAVQKRFHVDTTTASIPRPPPPSLPTLQVNAGGDQTVSILGQTFLSGQVSGVSDGDPRLALLWRQISPDPQTTRAVLATPNLQRTKVTFPKTGLYGFVLSSSFAMSLHLEDTVWMNVSSMAFVQPILGDTLRLDDSANVVWSDPITHASLSLQFSVDGGSNWSVIATGLASKVGLNSVNWTPAGAPSFNCLLRLLDNSAPPIEKARSGLFVVRAP